MFDDGFSAPLRAASGKDTARATSVCTSSYEVNGVMRRGVCSRRRGEGVTEVPQTKRDVGMPSLVDAATSDMHVEYVWRARGAILARHVPCVLLRPFARVGGRGDLCIPETVDRGPGHRRVARDCQPWASGAGVGVAVGPTDPWTTRDRTTRSRRGSSRDAKMCTLCDKFARTVYRSPALLLKLCLNSRSWHLFVMTRWAGTRRAADQVRRRQPDVVGGRLRPHDLHLLHLDQIFACKGREPVRALLMTILPSTVKGGLALAAEGGPCVHVSARGQKQPDSNCMVLVSCSIQRGVSLIIGGVHIGTVLQE